MSDSIRVNNDVKTLVRYSKGYSLEEKEYSVDPSAFCWTVGLEKGFRGANTIFPYAKNPQKSFREQKDLEKALKGSTFKETSANYKKAMDIQNTKRRILELEIKDIEKSNLSKQQKTALIDCKKAAYYNSVKSEINAAKNLDPKAYAKKIKDLEQQIADLNLKSATQKMAHTPTTKTGKALKAVKTYSGYYKANKKAADLVAKSAKLQKVAKFGRSNALSAVAFDVVLGIPEIYQTQKELGTEKALIQTGRMLAITGTQVAAYAVGAKSGAAIGAAIGSVIPGAGTLVGSILGAAIGLTASYFAGEAAQKVLGKSELDKAHDVEAQKLALEAQQDDEKLAQVISEANAKYSTDASLSEEDAEKINAAYSNTLLAYQNGEIGEQANITANNSTTPEAPTNTEAPKENKNTTSANTSTTDLAEEIKKIDAYISSLESITGYSYPTNSFDFTASMPFTNDFNSGFNFTMMDPAFNMPFNGIGMYNLG